MFYKYLPPVPSAFVTTMPAVSRINGNENFRMPHHRIAENFEAYDSMHCMFGLTHECVVANKDVS